MTPDDANVEQQRGSFSSPAPRRPPQTTEPAKHANACRQTQSDAGLGYDVDGCHIGRAPRRIFAGAISIESPDQRAPVVEKNVLVVERDPIDVPAAVEGHGELVARQGVESVQIEASGETGKLIVVIEREVVPVEGDDRVVRERRASDSRIHVEGEEQQCTHAANGIRVDRAREPRRRGIELEPVARAVPAYDIARGRRQTAGERGGNIEREKLVAIWEKVVGVDADAIWQSPQHRD